MHVIQVIWCSIQQQIKTGASKDKTMQNNRPVF